MQYIVRLLMFAAFAAAAAIVARYCGEARRLQEAGAPQQQLYAELAEWSRALQDMRTVHLVDRHAERLNLGQAAFLAGAFGLSAREAKAYVLQEPRPSLAWCLLADSSDRLKRHAVADAAARHCVP